MMFFPRVPCASILRSATVAGGFCLSAALSGCAHQSSTVAPPSDAQLCGSLQDVIDQSDKRFQKYKTTATISFMSGMTKWETKPVFPDSQCDVLEWAGGRTNYVCTWRADDESHARETFQKNSALMARCLGQTWTPAETRGQTGGATVFTKGGESTQVVMRYFQPRGGFAKSWETSLTIGDEVTSEPR
jgi:hypothetical protein